MAQASRVSTRHARVRAPRRRLNSFAAAGALVAIKPSSEIEIVLEIALRRQPLHIVCKQWNIKFRRRSVTAVCIFQIGACLFQLAEDSILVSKHAHVTDA